MKIAFCSDLHLNHTEKSAKVKLAKEIKDSDCDIVVCAGDIAESNSLENELVYLEKWFEKPFYFVLANHDYYGGSFYYTKQIANNISSRFDNIKHLPSIGIVELTKDTCLIGFDSMYDCLHGKCFGGKYDFELLDFCCIGDLRSLNRNNIYDLMVKMGASLAQEIKKELPKAFSKYKNVIAITHVPPFPEVCLYNGGPSQLEALPFFCNKQMGEALLDVMEEHTENNLTLLCGHTHSAAERQINDNFKVIVAGARYGVPKVFSYLDV